MFLFYDTGTEEMNTPRSELNAVLEKIDGRVDGTFCVAAPSVPEV